MSSWRFTPLRRGFESYTGYLGGGEDYWIHGTDTELDFWGGQEPLFNYTVRARPGRLSALYSVPQHFPMESHFVWGFRMGAQGA